MIAGVVAALLQGALPPVACPTARDDPAMSSALVCMPLVAVPEMQAASGVIELTSAHSVFGAAVTVDGRPRQRLRATIEGLPDPRSLGPYGTYVAWAYTLAMDSVVKLGAVTNGRVNLGELDRVQFRVLISAERSAAVMRRTGRLVLRGTSPSARLLAHRDFVQPSAVGASSDAGETAAAGMAAMHGGSVGADTRGVWTMPPMPAWMPMMPGMASLLPSAAPFLPRNGANGAPLPTVRRQSVIHMKSGDTLALEAGLVSRSVAGRTFAAYAFNGQLPGPLLDVSQGATIVVRFHNALDQPSSVHWHGIRLDNPFDGAEGVTQAAVRPGETFTYTVRFPDAGTYWYHPHVREDVQQSLGLFGSLLVRSPTPGYYAPVNREMSLMLDDALLGTDGPAAYGDGAPTHALMGRWGNVLLVNGELQPSYPVKRGDVVRFFLTNVSSARVYNVSFGGLRMKAVATDAGKFEREEWVQSVVIAPAERYVVEVAFPRAGTVALVNRVQALDHMIGSYAPETDTLARVRVTDAAAVASHAATFSTLRRNGDVAAGITSFRKYFDKTPDKELVLTLRTKALPAPIANMLIGINAPVEWNDGMPMANWLTTGNEVTWMLREPATGKENMDVDWHFKAGDAVKLRVFNDPATSHAMDHPIHLHGQRFLVLDRDGVRNDNLAWKDTALIAAGETVDLLVDMSNPGRWMLHCHIAEHLSAGMMTTFTVDPR
jgi:FtsP/CotA-like multicopper oxidase with cupredoxin domain